MSPQDLQSLLEKEKKAINSKNAKNILIRVFKKITCSNWKVFYDFMGGVLLEKPTLLEGKNSGKFLHGYNEFITQYILKKKKITDTQVIKMEEYFLKKFCLFEEEEILISFQGYIIPKVLYFAGDRIYITNMRFIVLSSFTYHGALSTGYLPGSGLLINLIRKTEAKRKKIRKEDSGKSSFTSVKLPFGNHYPAYNMTNLTLPIDEDGKYKGSIEKMIFTTKTETKSFDLELVIYKWAHENWEEISNQIIEILQKFQQQQS